MNYASRAAQLRQIAGVDAVAIVPGANMTYFTGLNFHLSKRPTMVIFTRDGGTSAIVPRLEMERFEAQMGTSARVFGWTDADGYMGAFKQAVDELGLRGKTLGVDGMTMRVTEWLAFQSIDPTLKVKAVERDITAIRAIKTPEELDLMRQAIKISEQALANLIAWVQPGMTEKTIAKHLAEDLLALGCDGYAFDTTVLTGPNSALPHADSGDRPLGKDEYLLIDFGGSLRGYPADITRTFCLGTPTADMQKIYDTVLAANEAGRAAVKPGVTMGAVDKAARDVITAAGYGEYFIHRTGHGLGLDIHESIPQIAAGVEDELKPGMTFTIEPGIYLTGFGGVRIEDNITVTATGHEVLTSYPRRLTV
jgi:Xaa-Pro dipeptidase